MAELNVVKRATDVVFGGDWTVGTGSPVGPDGLYISAGEVGTITYTLMEGVWVQDPETSEYTVGPYTSLGDFPPDSVVFFAGYAGLGSAYGSSGGGACSGAIVTTADCADLNIAPPMTDSGTFSCTLEELLGATTLVITYDMTGRSCPEGSSSGYLIVNASIVIENTGPIAAIVSFEDVPPMAEDKGWYRSDTPGIASNVNATGIQGDTVRPTPPRGIVITGPWTNSQPLWGFPGHAAVYDNRLIYAGGEYVVGTDLPPIRAYNGTNDYQLALVPNSSSGSVARAITTMIAADGAVYLGTWDAGTSSSDVTGRILKLDPNSGQLTNVGGINSITGYIPWALCFHNGYLWAGMHRSDGTAGRIYRIKPNEETSWTLDRDLTTDTVGPCLSIASFRGTMYFGSGGSSGVFAKLGSRDTTGTYDLEDTGTGGTATAANGYYAMCVFGDNLYASFWNPDDPAVSRIRKYDGSSWTTALDVTTIASVPIIAMFVENGVLYALGGLRSTSSYTGLLLTTPDGSTWTDRTVNLPLSGSSMPTIDSRMPVNAFGTIAY